MRQPGLPDEPGRNSGPSGAAGELVEDRKDLLHVADQGGAGEGRDTAGRPSGGAGGAGGIAAKA